jgi:4-hydroxy-2-oxoheptanedioate aldolase
LYGGADYVQQANDEIVVIIQIEHIEGVRNARDILSVPGIDAYFIGPNDLCMSMGLPPSLEPDVPAFWEALDSVRQAARACGVAPGIHVATPERGNRMLDEGYQFLSIASDAAFMATAASSTVKQLKRAAPPTPVGLRDASVLGKQPY